jgi:hypothetical protein
MERAKALMRVPRSSCPRPWFRHALALLGALTLTLPSSTPAQVLVQATPSRYDLELGPGRRESRPLFLHNLGRDSVKVRMRLSDLRMSDAGALDLVPPGTLASTLAQHMELEPAELSIGPGKRDVVRLKIALPPDGPATRCGVVLCSVTRARPSRTHGIPETPAELGTTVFVTRVPRESIRAEVVALDARAGADGIVAVEARVRNRSERYASCSGEVRLLDSGGETAIAGRLPEGVVLPGADRVFGWKGAAPLPSGRYVATVTIDVGRPELLVGRKEIVVARRRSHVAGNE